MNSTKLMATFLVVCLSGCTLGATVPQQRRNATILTTVGSSLMATSVGTGVCAGYRDCSCDHRDAFIAGSVISGIAGVILTAIGGDKLRRLNDDDTPCTPGDEQEVTMCDDTPRDIVWLIDKSVSMEDSDPTHLVEKGLEHLIPSLQGSDRVGVVIFRGDGLVLGELTSARWRFRDMIKKSRSAKLGTRTSISRGLQVASTLFKDESRRRVIWLLTDGKGDPRAPFVAREVRRKGIEIISMGFGPGADMYTLRRLASPNSAFYVENVNGMQRAATRTLNRLGRASWKECNADRQWIPKRTSCEPVY